jgi:hypothetical protein
MPLTCESCSWLRKFENPVDPGVAVAELADVGQRLPEKP